jgi:hypothetical protein
MGDIGKHVFAVFADNISNNAFHKDFACENVVLGDCVAENRDADFGRAPCPGALRQNKVQLHTVFIQEQPP